MTFAGIELLKFWLPDRIILGNDVKNLLPKPPLKTNFFDLIPFAVLTVQDFSATKEMIPT